MNDSTSSRPPLYRRWIGLPLILAAQVLGPVAAQAGPQAAEPAVTRLHFGTHSNRVAVEGALGGQRSARVYSFSARAGQRLTVDLRNLPSPHGSPGIVAMYHVTFPSGKQFGMKGYAPFDGRLTETGVYRVNVEVNSMASEGTQGRYRLVLSH